MGERCRVVSLVPSSTETLLALGADVVACTRFCEQPGLRHVGGTKNPDLDAIVELRPDVVVMDREENRREDHDELLARGIDVYASRVVSVDDAMSAIDDLAVLVGSSRRRAEQIPDVAALGAVAFVPIWRRPWMSIGAATYGASVLGHLGVELVTSGSVDPYPTVDLADISAQAPDLVVVPSEPYDFEERHLDELRAAMPDASIVSVDGRDLFWWGIRTPGAIGRLADVLAITRGR